MKTKIPGIGVLFILFLATRSVYSQTFTERTEVVLPGISLGSASWGDYDNDGDLDLLIAGIDGDNTLLLKVYSNAGGNFSVLAGGISPDPDAINAGWGNNYRAEWIDFNNDNFLDIIASGPSGNGSEISIYRNNSGISFTRVVNLPYITFQGGSSFDCGDYDNDGDIDIVLSNSVKTKIIRNKGSFSFGDVSINLPGLLYSSVRFFDYDNDNDLDLALSGQKSWTSVSYLFRNEGYDSYTQQNTSLNSGFIDKADYNNDGLTDILITGNSGIYKNNGDNTFSLQSEIDIPYLNDGTGRWGDFDNDGDNDFVITGNNFSKIYLNDGDNTFTEFAAGLTGLTNSFVSPGDYDSDGDLDIVIGGILNENPVCKLYRNESVVTNPAPAAPASPVSAFSGNDVILSWNPVTTDNTPAAALSYNLIVGTAPGACDIATPDASPAGYFRRGVTGNAQPGNAFVLRNLKKQSYYWKVQAVDNSFRGGAFSVQGSFNYNISVQAYGLGTTDKGGKECTIEWNRGNGANCIVFMKAASTGTVIPVNGTNYTANSFFGFGSQISGWFCVYKGTGTSVRVTNLNANSDYIFQVFEYEGAPTYNTQTASKNPLTFRTGLFTEISTVFPPLANFSLTYTQASSAYWFDSDNDNDLDLLLVGTSAAYFYRKDAGNTYTSLPLPFSGGYCASTGDYDNDGYIDIILNGNTGIYRNNQNNTFTLQPVTIPGVGYGPVAWNDYDNDGDLDFAISGDQWPEGNKSMIFRQNADGTFTQQELITFDQLAYGAIRWGDYDNDGLNDIVISGYNNEANGITGINRNTGNNKFNKKISAGLEGASTATIDWSDYDKDGDPDLLIGDFGNAVLYRNDGNWSFTKQTGTSLSSTGYGSVQWGDYDNDGDPDILLAGFSSTYVPSTKIFRNNGDNTFSEDNNIILPGAGFGSATFGDYDNDNDLDIIVEGIDADKSFTKIFRNDISTPNVKPVAPSSPVSSVNKSDATLKWRAVRSDNTPYQSMSYNIMVGTTSGAIDIMSPHSNTATGFRRMQMPGNAGYDTIFCLKNLPFGTYYWKVQAVDNSFGGSPFSAENSFQIVPVQASHLSATIENSNSLKLKWERGNGDRCVVFCKQTSSGMSSPVNNTSYIADGEYGFGSQIGTTGWYCVFNGRDDSVIVSGLVYEKEYSFHVIEYMGLSGSENYFTNIVNGNPGVFTTSLFAKQAGIVLPEGYYNPPAWGDYDNDGDPDLILPGNPTRIFTNNGDNTFTALAAVFPNIFNGSAAWVDYDNDNDLDFLLAGATESSPLSSPVTKLYRNNGAGNFTEQANNFQPVYYCSMEWYDYNGDGFTDLLLTGATGIDPDFNPVSNIYRNNGNSTFTLQTIPITGIMKGSATWGDYDNDGDPDLLLGGVLDNNVNHQALKLYRNNGNNTFSGLSPFDPAANVTLSWGDCDNDGDLDVLLSSYSFMKVYKNGVNNSFSEYFSAFYAYQDAAGAAWCDYDNDGFLDIISTRPGLNTEIYRNMKAIGGTFNRQDDAAFASTGCRFVRPADYDGDGDVDFILTRQAGVSLIFRNNLIMRSGQFRLNNQPASPANLSATYSPNGVKLSWSPAVDEITPSRALTYNVKIGDSTGLENITPSNSSAAGYRRIPFMGNAITDTSFLLKNMSAGSYYWKVQAVDQAYKGSQWSTEGEFEIKTVQTFFTADVVCQGQKTHFTDQSVAIAGLASWKWDFSDGSITTLQNPEHTFASSGVYNVKLVVTDILGFKDSLVQAVTVKAKPLASFNAPAVCQGTAATITNTTNKNGLTITAWGWNFGDGSTSAVEQPAPHGYLISGNYTVTLTTEASNGCSDIFTSDASIGTYPVASVTANAPLSFCEGDSVILAVAYNKNYLYNWKIDGTNLTNGDTSRFSAKISGNYTVEITNPVGNCISVSPPARVTARPAPYAPVLKAFNYTPGSCPGENPVRLAAEQESEDYKYIWFKDGVAMLRDTMPYINTYEAGNYKLLASQGGCIAESKMFQLSFPEAFPKPVIYTQGPNVWYMACSNTGADFYKWYYNGTLIEGATRYLYVANQKLGQYQVSIGNSQRCFVRSDIITIPGNSDINKTSPLNSILPGEINIYPNPSRRLFTITMENEDMGEVEISITDYEGKKSGLYKYVKDSPLFTVTIDPGNLKRGNYLVFIGLNRKISVQKFIIE